MDVSHSTQATTKEACLILRVTPETLRRWEAKGKIKSTRTSSNQRRYNLQEYFYKEESYSENQHIRAGYIYARVSSSGQKEDLERQVNLLKRKYPEHILIKDIGSGLNFKRKGLQALVERILKGEVEEIVVTHRDRLTRFGFDLIEQILLKTNPQGRIVVLDESKTSPQQELTDDLISIITVFSSRLYGLRSHKHKDEESENLSDTGGEGETKGDVSSFSLEL